MKNLFAKALMVFVITLTLFGSAIGVAPVRAATLTVLNTNDSGTGSLRQAIADAAASDTINFDSSLTGQTIYLVSPLTLSQDIIIDGSALAVPVIISGDSDNDGDGDVRIMNISSGTTVVLTNLIFAKGRATSDTSGAIENAGALTINNSVFLDNYADNGGGAIFSYGPMITITNSSFLRNVSNYGGGALQAVNTISISNSIFSYNSSSNSLGGGAIYSAGTLTVTNSTFSHNASTTHAGGIDVVNGTATITGSTFDHNSAAGGASIAIETGTANVSNSTFTDNTATGIAGGIYNNGTLNLTNSTFSGNTAVVGAGVASFNVLNYANNIIANSNGAADCYNVGSIGTNTNNLVEDASPSCSPGITGDPNLGDLDDNGGPTQTMALRPGSVAIDAGDNTTCAASPISNLDQRGVTRPIGTNCDLGAFEYSTAYIVTKDADTNDGTCDTDCSLREAIVAANADATGDIILFNDDFTITLTSSLPALTEELTINGQDYLIVIDGGSAYNIFDASVSLYLKNLTIQNATYGNGGALVLHSPSSIFNVSFLNNTATNNGGAVYTTSTLDIRNSTFSGNTASGGGGAIKNDGGTLTISNSTFSGNSAGVGGAIIALGGGSTTLIRSSTFSGNSGGAIYNNGTLSYASTIIANSTGTDCTNDGATGFNLNNLVEDGSCSASLSGDPNLGTLANNGGTTQTLALSAPSPAINTGNDAVCALAPINSLDQRGIARPNGPHCDIGAYEYVDTTPPSVTAFTVPSTSNSLSITISDLTASDNVAVAGYKVTETNTPPLASDIDWTASFPSSYTVSSEGSYTLYPWAKDGAGNISAVYGSPASVTVDTTPPCLCSITRVNTNPTNRAKVGFTVTFSESVTGIDIADFTLTTSGVSGASVVSMSGSGATRTVTVNTGSGNGSIRLDLPVTATITDIAGNALSGLPYTSGETYTVNKTMTFSSLAAQDGWVLESSETSGLGGTFNNAATTFNLGDDASKKQYRGILSFNTGNLPDNAVITGITLKVKKSSVTGGGNPVSIFQGFIVDIKKGILGTSALQTSDFQAAASKTYGPFSPTPVSNWYSINLTTGKAYINKLATNSGLTQIRLRFKLDDNNNTIANILSLFSGNAPAGSKPQLVITYYVP